MRHAMVLIAAAILAAAVVSAPVSARAGEGRILPFKREGGLGTLGTGNVKKKSPARERVHIGRDESAAPGVLEKKDPLVIITSPKAGDATHSIQKVSARIGNNIAKAFLRVNEDTSIVTVNSGEFSTEAALRPGLNTVTVLAWDLDGNLGKDYVKVFLAEDSVDGVKLSITEPEDGAFLDTTSDRVIKVRASLKGGANVDGILLVNGVRHLVRFERGKMEREVALMPGVNEIMVEAKVGQGFETSPRVKVTTFDARPKDLVAVLTWDAPGADADLHVWDSFGHHTFNEAADPRLCEPAIPKARLDMDRRGGGGPEVFTLEAAEPEVYTFYANYNPGIGSIPTNATLSVILYGEVPARRFMRVFGPMPLSDKDRAWEAAVVKMPEGVFFQEKDQDLTRTLAMDSKAVRRLLLVLDEENPSFRLLAVTALGRIKNEQAVPKLSEVLLNDGVDMRRAAAGALWSIRSVESIPPLCEALFDTDHEVRRAAAGALGYIGDEEAVRPLTTLLSEEGDPLVRSEAIRALGAIGYSGAGINVIPFLVDPNPAIRSEAARALGRISEPSDTEAVSGLLEALDDDVPGVRELSAWALGELGAKKAVGPLMDVLHFDDSEDVRAEAALALGRIGDKEGIAELEQARDKDFSDKVRFCSRKAMEELSPEELQPKQVIPPVELDEDVIIY